MKEVILLGATGSIGDSSLKIIRENSDKFTIKALFANNNWQKLAKLAKEFKPELVCIFNEKHYQNLKESLPNFNISCGETAINEISSIKSDILISAITGIAALKPSFLSLRNTKILALANKESIVCAGNIFLKEAQKHKVTIIPVDSEHNAIYQLLKDDKEDIKKITLTASGGPFLNRDLQTFKDIKIAEALQHPNWNMGNKITIDSSTMVNKALEMIEAHFLFSLPENKISVVIHPESIIHSFVHYIDGNIKALLGEHDMRLAISYALSFPKRLEQKELCYDITKYNNLSFFEPDLKKFPILNIARKVIKEGGIMPIIFNVSNEIAVDLFLNKKISFVQIVEFINKNLDSFKNEKLESIEQIFEINSKIPQT